MSDVARHPCEIEFVGKTRAGTTRFWCKAHGANATGRFGVRLEQCERAHLDVDRGSALKLDATRFAGGVALWASVDPVFDSTKLPPDRGVHVHAREVSEGSKEIDESYPAVEVAYQRDLLESGHALITHETAVSYYLSRFLKRSITCLFCTYCGAPHLDAEYFAIKPHRKHLCHGCGRYFHVDARTISNPLALASRELSAGHVQPEPVPAARKLNISQKDYPGGIQIWASNPAIIWTADRPEESGIHVHAYDEDGHRVEDDTFSEVVIDGHKLDQEQVAYLMAQKSLSFLKGKIVTLDCSHCGQPTFDRDDAAFWPESGHVCSNCGERFEATGHPKRVVANPLVRTLDLLKANLKEVA